MSVIKKIMHKARTVRGTAKKAPARLTGGRRLKAEGRAGETTGNVGLAAGKISDTFKH